MVDETDDTLPPQLSPMARLKKLVTMLCVLIAAFLILTRALPYFLLPHSNAPLAMPAPATAAPAPADAPQAPDNVARRLDEIEARLKTLEDVVSATPKTAAPDAASAAKIADLEAKVNAMADESGTDERIGGIEDKVKTLESQVGESQNKTSREMGALAALSQLREAASHGEPLGGALSRLNALAQGNDKALDLLTKLAPFADKPIPGMARLRQDFAADIKPALAKSAGDSLIDWRGLVSIRKVGPQQGTDDESVIARAETALDRGDLETTFKELASLSPAAAPVFAPWTAEAKYAKAAHDAIDALQAALSSDAAQ